MSYEAWGDGDEGDPHEGCLTQMQVDEAVEEATEKLRGLLLEAIESLRDFDDDPVDGDPWITRARRALGLSETVSEGSKP